MLRYFRQNKSFRFVLISTLLTIAAIVSALVSAVAGQIGEYEISSIGSIAALALALVIVFYVVPRLARSIRVEYLRSEYSVHMPNAGLIFCALILVVMILALSSGNNLLYVVLAVLLSTMFVSWLASRLCLGRVGIAVRFPDHIFVDEAVPFDVTMTNRRRLMPAFSIATAISEQRRTDTGQELTELVYFQMIPAKTRACVKMERSFTKRGVYPVRGYLLGTKFPFGFIEHRRFIEDPGEIVVYPKLQPLDEFFHLMPLTQGRVESRRKGSGSDLYAIRRYISSDHHHHIDWKATAKTTQLMVREFTRDDDWRVTVAFDTQFEKQDAGSPEFVEKFERGVVFVASLIDSFVKGGAEVRLLTPGHDSGFGIGQMHCYRMLRRLAQLDYETIDDGSDVRAKTLLSPPLDGDEQLRILITSSARHAAASQSMHSTHVINIEEL